MTQKMKEVAGRGFCRECKKEVDVVIEDFGIGSYEYWGDKGTDVRLEPVCVECEEQMSDEDIDYFPPDEPDFYHQRLDQRLDEDDWRKPR